MARYAAGTKTGVSYSQTEVQKILTRGGCTHTMFGEGPEGSLIGFQLHGRQYRLSVTRPSQADAEKIARREGVTPHLVRDWQARIDAEWRRRWRAAVLWTKATIEYADGDPEVLERAFLGSMSLPDGRTFSQWAQPQIAVMYDSGQMPPLLGTGS